MGLPKDTQQWMNSFVKSTTDTMTDDHARDDAYQASLRFLYDRINYEKMASGTARYPFRLHRTNELLKRLDLGEYLHDSVDRPKVPIVHIAGTKGKGSTSTMVATSLSAAGVRTGLYTSPHLNHLEERFQIDGVACSPKQFTDLVNRIKPVAETLEADDLGSPSFFELTTAIALLHFDTQQCDAIVLEVGLGGRLDSTNICQPSVTAITSIGLDHQHVLGNTIAEIAAEKAGIIKPNVPVVSGLRPGDAADVIAERCSEQQSPLFKIGRDFDFERQPHRTWGSRVTFTGQTSPLKPSCDFDLKLEGAHQAQNAAVAFAILNLLAQDHGFSLTAVADGMSSTRCPARIERFDLPYGVTAILDAAHNSDSITALGKCLAARFSKQPIVVVFGTSRDKSAEAMLAILAQFADMLILTQFQGNPRYAPVEDLLPLVPNQIASRVVVEENPIEGCKTGLESLDEGGTMVVCGSFFLAAETRNWIIDQQSPA